MVPSLSPSFPSSRASGQPESWASERACASADLLPGGRDHAEGGGASREAAGLVILKTTSAQQPQTTSCHRENDPKFISFGVLERRAQRLKKLRSTVWTSGQLHRMSRPGFRPDVPWFVTLTYAKPDEWRPNHIRAAVDAFRSWCKRRGIPCRYTWVAELTKTGRVHYHLICWLPQGVRMTFWDKPRRVKGKRTEPFWPHGMSNTQACKAGVSYLMKYLSKMGELHAFPEGMRLYGVGGLDQDARSIRQWQNLPQWVKNDHGVGGVKRFGRQFVDMETGEVLAAMFRRRFVSGGVELIQLRDMPEKLYDHGPWCAWPRIEN